VTIEGFSALLAIFSASLFTGAAVYVSLVEHPARISCGTELAVMEFAPSYQRAAVLQASLAILTFVFSLATWLMSGTAWWLVGGLFMVAAVPFTLIVILPTNKALMDPSLDKRSPKAAQLLTKWGWLHAVRTGLSLLSLLVFLLLVVLKL
jgi:uncharacterized membrane protein